MSLRHRVLIGFAAITILLVVTDAIIAVSVQRSLVDQVDRRLEAAAAPLARIVARRGGLGGGYPPFNALRPPSQAEGQDTTTQAGQGNLTEVALQMLNADGTVDKENEPIYRNDEAPPHLDPAQARREATEPQEAPRYFTVGASGQSPSYRAVVLHEPVSSSYLVVAISLKETNATYNRILAVTGASTAAVLVALALIAFWVIRLGVRPIDEMAATANAIADGDLSRRVDVESESTEVGRLGRALNGMLHQIEGAFAQRQTSEDRLRRFVADASHELRTPLTSIRGYTELYRTGIIADGPQLQDAMRRIEGEAGRMGELVDDLLLLARLDQGRPLEARPVDLAALARDTVADARAVEPDRAIGVDAPSEPVVVIGDEARLRQVLGNLMANARAHTPPATPVDVRVHVEGANAVVEVADHGPGIDPAVADRVFERFVRGDPARTRDHGGTGLGLAIVSAVAESHHGHAWVASVPGRGACFGVELPLAPA